VSVLLPSLLGLAALGLLWRILHSFLYPSQSSPSQPTESVDDPFAPVPATRKYGPKGLAGAVALEEPDDDDPADCVPPRSR
jgi:hypothetical protein